MKRFIIPIIALLALIAGSVVWGTHPAHATVGSKPIKHAVAAKTAVSKRTLAPNYCAGPTDQTFASVHRINCGGTPPPPPTCASYNQGQYWYGFWHNPGVYDWQTRWWRCGTVYIVQIGGGTTSYPAWLAA